MKIGDEVQVDLAGIVTAVEPGRLTIRATEGGAVWTVGTVVDVPAGATVEQAAEQAPSGVCRGFAWLGQSLAHCDRCGRPFWEHTHDERAKPGAGPFDPDGWVLVPITPEQADAARRKWSA